jgi:L-ribulose-5-phosphate 3-epimerase
MFKLASFTDEISQDFETAVGVCVEYGVPAVEIRSVWNKPPEALADDDLKRMLDIMAGPGLVTACIASPFFKCDLGDAEAYTKHLGILKRCCQTARTMGTDIVRGFTFWRVEGLTEAQFGQVLDCFEEPCRILAGEGMRLGIENEHSCNVGTGGELRRFLEALAERAYPGCERVGGIWDPANHVYAREVPAFPDGYEAVKDLLIHVHIKDARWDGDSCTCVEVGTGQIDYPAQFRALRDDGYTGYCSLETHWRPQALSEEEIKRPGGAAYSESGEYASRVCLANINRMVGELA